MKKLVPDDAVLVPEEATLVFSGIIYSVYQWQQTLFDNSKTTFEMLKRPDTVATICIVDDKILVLEEEQPHSGVRTSFPTGRVDTSDESTLTAAKREVLEETGYSFNSWKLIGIEQPHTKIEWFIYTYVAWGASNQTTPHLDAGEKIELKQLPFETVKQWSLKPHKNSYMGESSAYFEPSKSIDDLQKIAEFQGQSVDR